MYIRASLCACTHKNNNSTSCDNSLWPQNDQNECIFSLASSSSSFVVLSLQMRKSVSICVVFRKLSHNRRWLKRFVVNLVCYLLGAFHWRLETKRNHTDDWNHLELVCYINIRTNFALNSCAFLCMLIVLFD